ncbi:unnamed protein product [Rotaria sp. Silwood2]|nr:unnamed protein product [Rotaria sp. Silwood2]
MGKGAECTAIIFGAATTGAGAGAGFGAVTASCVFPGLGTIAGATGGAIVGGTAEFVAGAFGAVVHAMDDK